MDHISKESFKTIYWLPDDQRVQQSLNVTFLNMSTKYALIA